MSAPMWSAIDDDSADLLALVAMGAPSTGVADIEWDAYVDALATVAIRNAGLIHPNELRPLVRGRVKPNRIGAFTHRALKAGLVRRTGDWQISDDREGRNSGRPAPVMEWIGGQR